MLELINSEREKAGLGSVVLGDNAAAQLHAEAALENCFASHWGVDGLKPYMRYSLAGGYQSNGENGLGIDYCVKASDGYAALGSIESEIREAMVLWMGSAGHRRNILRKWHKKVNIGIAWNRYNFAAYQHFEGDYVEYDRTAEHKRRRGFDHSRAQQRTARDSLRIGISAYRYITTRQHTRSPEGRSRGRTATTTGGR